MVKIKLSKANKANKSKKIFKGDGHLMRKIIHSSNQNLIEELINDCLIKRGSREHNFFLKVDRRDFCINEHECYRNRPSRLTDNQTISAPHMHAYAVKELINHLKPGNKVLDVGSGSGYLCALFAYLVDVKNNGGQVIGIDIYDTLINNSISNININHADLFNNKRLNIIKANGWNGYPANKNEKLYDAIHVGATATEIPLLLWKQLKRGGRLFIPVQDGNNQIIHIIDKPEYKKKYGLINIKKTLNVKYVPLQKL